VEGKGVLLVENGLIYNAVAPPGGGRVSTIPVESGKIVKKGDVLAILERPDLLEKIQLQKNYVDKLKKEQVELRETADRELKARHSYIEQQKNVITNTLQNEQKNLKDIQDLLTLKEANFKKGLVVWQDIESTRRDFYGAKDRIEQLQVQFTQLTTQEDDFKEQWRQRLKDKDLLILGEELKLSTMQSELNVSKNVTSPVDGIVISVNTSLGKMVPDGGSVATITSLGEGLDALIFMLPKDGERVFKDMDALVAPVTIIKEEYGSMRGRVLNVSEFPEAAETITAVLHNEELTKQFIAQGAPTAVRIRIERDTSTYSGYKWSSSDGPDKKISPGTLAEARITVKEQPPITLIVPAFKKLFGIS
jgi:HlyD family secretion protein